MGLQLFSTFACDGRNGNIQITPFSGSVAKASAPGKLILFGEHFVVHGLPAIAAAVEGRTIAEVKKVDRFSLVDDRPETPGYKKDKGGQQADSIRMMFDAMRLDPAKVKIILSGDLVAASGVGASGASCAAIAAAANAEFKLGLDRDGINGIAYEGEKGYHGNPSGIDNSCSTYGGFIRFRKGASGGRGEIVPMGSKAKLSMVVGNTGITSNTTKVVEEVKRLKEKDPAKFKRTCDEYLKIANDAKEALDGEDLPEIGRLMNMNHALLREIGVTCKELEAMVGAALKAGALGAKLTGTGRGGLMIALVTSETKEGVASAIAKSGFKSEVTGIGTEGVKVLR
jgi:mevalonate kinase